MKTMLAFAPCVVLAACASHGMFSTAVGAKDPRPVGDFTKLDYRLMATRIDIKATYEILKCAYQDGEEPIKLVSADLTVGAGPDPSPDALYTIDPQRFGGFGIDVTESKIAFSNGTISEIAYGSKGVVADILTKTIELVGVAGSVIAAPGIATNKTLPCSAGAAQALARNDELIQAIKKINGEVAAIDKLLPTDKDPDALLKRRKSLTDAFDRLAADVMANRGALKFEFAAGWTPPKDAANSASIDYPVANPATPDDFRSAMTRIDPKAALDPMKLQPTDADAKDLLALMRFTLRAKPIVAAASIPPPPAPEFKGVYYREPVASELVVEWRGRFAAQYADILQFGQLRGVEVKGKLFGTTKTGAKWSTGGRLTEFTLSGTDNTAAGIGLANAALDADRTIENAREKREVENLKSEKELIETRNALAKLKNP